MKKRNELKTLIDHEFLGLSGIKLSFATLLKSLGKRSVMNKFSVNVFEVIQS